MALCPRKGFVRWDTSHEQKAVEASHHDRPNRLQASSPFSIRFVTDVRHYEPSFMGLMGPGQW
jgi:hypothetical protein